MRKPTITGMGGGDSGMEPDAPLLDDHIPPVPGERRSSTVSTRRVVEEPSPLPGSEELLSSGCILATDRLVLRWWRLDDADAMFGIFGDPAVHVHTGAEPYQSPAAARAWLEREVVEAPARGYGHWAVVEQASGEVVGSCGFRGGSPPGEPEIGFTIARSKWGQGYATEIAAACVRFATENLAASKVVSMTRPGNRPARRVLEKIGMELLGEEEHDGVVWCVYEIANLGSNKHRKTDNA